MTQTKIALACSVCGARNYQVAGGKLSHRLTLKKYCRHCGKQTLHQVTR
ncbi:50S ribosomal protein L33 [Fructilactobacillus myrtifloralis]|uniref:Large ribosomal subunit protein bL33 n=1 Tax=Fructilactobacillus myrtifloralis TaxID=2940301 RepID=A0ABY5BMJ8_9LACO|nr:50S ribosomal protein L33 [Fructilactobacillus myrtifloralis]USS84913.1 50S ribosomal protein L33 [Fructilactobacillus myrtifloralis]